MFDTPVRLLVFVRARIRAAATTKSCFPVNAGIQGPRQGHTARVGCHHTGLTQSTRTRRQATRKVQDGLDQERIQRCVCTQMHARMLMDAHLRACIEQVRISPRRLCIIMDTLQQLPCSRAHTRLNSLDIVMSLVSQVSS